MQEIINAYGLTYSKCLIANTTGTRSAKRIYETLEFRDFTEKGDRDKHQHPHNKTSNTTSHLSTKPR